MSSKHDIENINDIKLLVNTFYDKIRKDDFLASIFNERIKDNWAQHLEKMYRFWQTVLLEEHTYFGSPFPPHANLPVDHARFQQRLAFIATSILLLQITWLFPALNERATAVISGKEVSASNLHRYFIVAELTKTILIIVIGWRILLLSVKHFI